LSGLLVTNSLFKKKSVSEYLIARAFRILPALALVLVVSALIIGPLCTSMNFSDYFTNPNTYLYIKRQLLMQSWGTQGLGYYNLPGLFADNAYKNNVNASLWTLVVEIYAYLFLAVIYLVGITEKRVAVVLIVLVVLDSLLPSRILFTFLPQGNEDFSYLPFCFACGALLALHKENVRIPGIMCVIGLIVLFYLMHGTVFERFIYYLATFAGILYFASNSLILRFRPKVDVSYGVYLWGFPIQQTLAHSFPGMGRPENFLLAILIAIVIGYFSWVVVEKRSIQFGKRITVAIRNSTFGVTGKWPSFLSKALKYRKLS
jgi:peptidoglycan/LPS O-acetylase OafA/YrhL